MKNKKIRIFIIVLILIILAYILYNKHMSVANTKGSDKTNEVIEQTIWSIDISEFKNELAVWDRMLIDIRTKAELDNVWTIKQNVLNIDFYWPDFVDNLNKLDKSKKYLIYCRSGNRTKSALNIMKKEWFKYVQALNGGIISWINNWEKIFK